MIEKKWIVIAYVLAIVMGAFLVLGFWGYRWAFAPAVPALIGYVYVVSKKACCPHCGATEKLSNLRHAVRGGSACSHCGKKIEVR